MEHCACCVRNHGRLLQRHARSNPAFNVMLVLSCCCSSQDHKHALLCGSVVHDHQQHCHNRPQQTHIQMLSYTYQYTKLSSTAHTLSTILLFLPLHLSLLSSRKNKSMSRPSPRRILSRLAFLRLTFRMTTPCPLSLS